jgi:hypothetical protein
VVIASVSGEWAIAAALGIYTSFVGYSPSCRRRPGTTRSTEEGLALVGAALRLRHDQVDQPLGRLPLHRELRPIHLVMGDHVLQPAG